MEQTAILFNKIKQNIGLNIKNCIKEKKLTSILVDKESLTTITDNKNIELRTPILM